MGSKTQVNPTDVVESIGATSTDTSAVLKPDGAGGVEFVDLDITELETSSTDTERRLGPDGAGSVSVQTPLAAYSQNSEPTLAADGNAAIWVDTDDSNRVYLVYRRGTGDQVKVELT